LLKLKTRDPVRVTTKPSASREDEAASHVIWSGTISFSLVAIPVYLVRAVEAGRVPFHLLHSKDYSTLQRRMFCPAEEKIVPPDEIVRGYEIGPDKYVLITDEELESLSPERSRTIEIVEFIDMKEVDPIYYDHPYYLVPSKGGEKAYQLLVEVMGRTSRAGLARFVMGDREYLVAVKNEHGALALITLHYHEEILPDKEILPKDMAIEDEEKMRIKKGIKRMMSDFDPEKYADRRREKIDALLKRKIKEKAPVLAPEAGEGEGGGPADLVAALKKSMRKVKKR
jgi:DNA end-binding protein Ku